jgi:hypothetical protein
MQHCGGGTVGWHWDPGYGPACLYGKGCAGTGSHGCHVGSSGRFAAIFSDTSYNGQVSDLMKHRLTEYGCPEMEVFMKMRDIRTVNALEMMSPEDASTHLCQARTFYESMRLGADFPNYIRDALSRMFPTCEPQSLWTGNLPEPLVEPLDDDSYLKKTLIPSVHGSLDIIGPQRYSQCLQLLKLMEDMIRGACVKGAEALAVLAVPKNAFRNKQEKELWKRARLALRDNLFWCCGSNAKGLDSEAALKRIWTESCRRAGCDANTASQMSNTYNQVRDRLLNNLPPGPRMVRSVQEQQLQAAAAGAAQQPAAGITQQAAASTDGQGPAALVDSSDLDAGRRSPGGSHQDTGCSRGQIEQMWQTMKLMSQSQHRLEKQMEQLLRPGSNQFPSYQGKTFVDEDDSDSEE